MTAPPERSDWLTVPQMARRLGVSEATLKRRIADHKPVRLPGGAAVEIEAELLERPQGHEYRVRIVGNEPPLSSVQERSVLQEPPALSSVQDSAQALTAALETVGGLVERTAVLSGRVAVLERENGRLEGRATAAETRATDLAARLAEAERQLARPWYRRLLGLPPA